MWKSGEVVTVSGGGMEEWINGWFFCSLLLLTDGRMGNDLGKIMSTCPLWQYHPFIRRTMYLLRRV